MIVQETIAFKNGKRGRVGRKRSFWNENDRF